jgi:ketosteroid isomerase-like protein
MRIRRLLATRQLPALAAVLALAIAGAACGDSDDGKVGGEEGAVRETVDGLYQAMRDGDAEGVCEHLDEEAQKQIITSPRGKKRSCAQNFQRFLDEAEKNGGLDLTLKAKVEKVTIKGKFATAKVSYGKETSGDIQLRKYGDEWKLAAAKAQEPPPQAKQPQPKQP